MTNELLTPAEHDAIAMTAELWNLLCAITTDGAARDGDLRELIFHIHGIQRAVLKQAAARAYPDLYRLLGGDPPPSPDLRATFVAETVTCSECVAGEQPKPRPRPPHRPPPLPNPVQRDLVRFPFWCSLRGHSRWRSHVNVHHRRRPGVAVRGGWIRRTCPRCIHLDPPTP